MFLILGFGILGSVPINSRAMRDPRWGQFWTSLAGPLSNLIQALVFAALNWLVFNTGVRFADGNMLLAFVRILFFVGVFFNILLFFFNLLPLVFPGGILGGGMNSQMDGWYIIYSLLPGNFLERKQVPNLVWQFAPPIGNFLVHPAYTWRDWMPVLGIITLIIFLSSFILPQLNLVSFLVGTPATRFSLFLLGISL
jgi:hypothetical protein